MQPTHQWEIIAVRSFVFPSRGTFHFNIIQSFVWLMQRNAMQRTSYVCGRAVEKLMRIGVLCFSVDLKVKRI